MSEYNSHQSTPYTPGYAMTSLDAFNIYVSRKNIERLGHQLPAGKDG